MQDCIHRIEFLVKKIQTFNSFEENWVEQDAMIRNFEIIGEASNHISKDLKEKYPDLAWNEMRGMRNFMTHEYFGLQLDTIWETAVHDIPFLKLEIAKIISDLKEQ
ncbi:DUF86 domain-containing protein [Weeksellaceae bacterium TAE3-ERU29]|nr:DUF86 domain-containing protein [Weeksellaceae bacterium TAE3-ERU29]